MSWKSLTVTPDPITGSGGALPFRWEVDYNPPTGAILDTEFDIGLPPGLGNLRIGYPVADNVLGSATYSGTPAGLPVKAGVTARRPPV